MDEFAPQGEMILYQTSDGRTRLECRFADQSIWLTQRLMAELFQTSIPNINQHLAAIFDEGELAPDRTIKKYLIVQIEGGRQISRLVDHYNLDAILAVGYRVRSPRGTAFRQWATARLSEYLVKGFTLDDERLKNPPGPGAPDYFDELLERIRDIRSSERRMYLQVRNVLALAADYDPKDEESNRDDVSGLCRGSSPAATASFYARLARETRRFSAFPRTQYLARCRPDFAGNSRSKRYRAVRYVSSTPFDGGGPESRRGLAQATGEHGQESAEAQKENSVRPSMSDSQSRRRAGLISWQTGSADPGIIFSREFLEQEATEITEEIRGLRFSKSWGVIRA